MIGQPFVTLDDVVGELDDIVSKMEYEPVKREALMYLEEIRKNV